MKDNRRKKAMKSQELILEEVDQELFIEEESINEELRDQPLKFRKWSKLEAQCEKKVKSIRMSLENAEAEAYQAAKNEGEKKSVKDLEYEVRLDSEVQHLKKELDEAEHELADVKMIVKAFYQRHEMLKDLSANLRKDMMD